MKVNASRTNTPSVYISAPLATPRNIGDRTNCCAVYRPALLPCWEHIGRVALTAVSLLGPSTATVLHCTGTQDIAGSQSRVCVVELW